jgi:hypothetical protein
LPLRRNLSGAATPEANALTNPGRIHLQVPAKRHRARIATPDNEYPHFSGSFPRNRSTNPAKTVEEP